jgi:hypothetical protein
VVTGLALPLSMLQHEHMGDQYRRPIVKKGEPGLQLLSRLLQALAQQDGLLLKVIQSMRLRYRFH